MDRIYHGCMTKNSDGTNRLIGPREKCLVPAARPFWKYLENIETSGVKTRTQHKKQTFETIRPFLRCLMFVVSIFTNVSNGNILAGGTDERKYLQIKYNEL